MCIVIRRASSLWIFLLFLSGCSTSHMSYSSPQTNIVEKCEIKSIAVNPSGGLLADAIAVNLASKGYNVYDTQQTSTLFARLNMDEFEVSSGLNLEKLKDRGVDAYLSVRTIYGADGLPESATVRVNKTSNGKLVLGITWSNGWGGQQGSMADRTMRKNLTQAASEISRGLIKAMPCPSISSSDVELGVIPESVQIEFFD